MFGKNRDCVLLLRYLLVPIVVCAALGTCAYGQNFNCPQVVLSETHTCSVGKCKGQYPVNNCDTSDNTSSYQCVYQYPTCCGKQQVAFDSAAEGADCPNNCSLNKKGSAATASLASGNVDRKNGAVGTKQAQPPAKVKGKGSKS